MFNYFDSIRKNLYFSQVRANSCFGVASICTTFTKPVSGRSDSSRCQTGKGPIIPLRLEALLSGATGKTRLERHVSNNSLTSKLKYIELNDQYNTNLQENFQVILISVNQKLEIFCFQHFFHFLLLLLFLQPQYCVTQTLFFNFTSTHTDRCMYYTYTIL